jgi:hypothetical protein
MRVPDPAEDFVVRLDEARERLAVLADADPGRDLTEPDPDTGERWEAPQAWAHMAEFVPYWIGQLRGVLDAEGDEPAPFGRIKSDPGRIAAIETGRHEPIAILWERLSAEIGDLKAFLAGLSEDDWGRRGEHQTLGVMPMERMVDRFLVGHLEEHLDQLEGLAPGSSSPGPPTG